MNVIQVSGETIRAFHEIAFIAHLYSTDHLGPKGETSPERLSIAVSVFADMYPTHFSFMRGAYCFVSSVTSNEKEVDPDKFRVSITNFPHSWLVTKDSPNVIVDVFPLYQPPTFKTSAFVVVGEPGLCGVAGYKALSDTCRVSVDPLVLATKRDELGDIFTSLQDRCREVYRHTNG